MTKPISTQLTPANIAAVLAILQEMPGRLARLGSPAWLSFFVSGAKVGMRFCPSAGRQECRPRASNLGCCPD